MSIELRPSWRRQPVESAPVKGELTDAQRLTAQIVYSRVVLNTLTREARKEVPRNNKQNVVERVIDLAEAYTVHNGIQEGKEGAAERQEAFNQRENSSELLARVTPLYDQLQEEKEEIFGKMQHAGSWRQRGKRGLAKHAVRKKLGKANEGLLYENTDTTLEEERLKTKTWVKSLGVTAAFEGTSHLGAALSAYFDVPEHLLGEINSTPGRLGASIVLTGALWGILYGPLTKKNTNLLMDEGVSTTVTAKGAHETASEYQKQDAATVRGKANFWNRFYHLGWEGVYAAEAVALGLHSGVDAGADYASGGAMVSIATNLGLVTYLEIRERRRNRIRNRAMSLGETQEPAPGKDLLKANSIY